MAVVRNETRLREKTLEDKIEILSSSVYVYLFEIGKKAISFFLPYSSKISRSNRAIPSICTSFTFLIFHTRRVSKHHDIYCIAAWRLDAGGFTNWLRSETPMGLPL